MDTHAISFCRRSAGGWVMDVFVHRSLMRSLTPSVGVYTLTATPGDSPDLDLAALWADRLAADVSITLLDGPRTFSCSDNPLQRRAIEYLVEHDQLPLAEYHGLLRTHRGDPRGREGPRRRDRAGQHDHRRTRPDVPRPPLATRRVGRAEEARAALDAAAPCPMLFAVGLLGLNCTFLPIDLATIPLRAIDLEAGVHHFPRGKNCLPRSAVLMPETIAAIRRYLKARPAPRSDDEPLVVREDGQPFCALRSNRGPVEKSDHGNPIARYWSDVTGLTLKGLRTTFATEADGCHDQAAVDLVMGHAATSVRARHHVKSFDPERLRSAISLVWRRLTGQAGLQDVAPIAPRALAMRRRSARRRDALAKLQAQTAGSGTAGAMKSRSARPKRGSAKEVMKSDQLRLMARELAEMVKKMPKLDWTQRESVRANLRRKVRRLFSLHGYPPGLSEDATTLVLRQAELST